MTKNNSTSSNSSKPDEEKEKEKVLLEDIYRPNENIQEFIYDVYDKFIRWRSIRQSPHKQFNNQTLTDYLNDARKKFWGYLPLNPDAETPSFFFPETRNQIIAILAKIANLRIKPRFDGVEGFDVIKSIVLKDLAEYWRRCKSRKIENFWQFLYNIINGTVIVFTAYQSRVRKVKTITGYDPATGETSYKEEELDESDVADEIINLEDFYFPKLWEPDIQKQGKLIVRTLLPLSEFKETYKGYANVDYFIAGSQFADESIFADLLSYDVRSGDFVEVLRFFNIEDKDQYAIIANGVLLNPIKKKGKEEVAPMPWNHKRLPFSKTIFEPIDCKFFFGIPLAQKVKSPQEALNKMWELMLEREEKSVAAPIITNDPSVELGLEFKPGRVYQVNTDVSQYREMPVSPSSSSYWNALMSLQGIIQRTGSGGVTPIIPSRQPRSATERAQVAQQEKETSGLYFLFYQDLLEQKIWIALMNMIQFYTAETTEKILGTRKFNKILSLSDIDLLEGGIGNREIRITKEPLKPKELYKESYIRSLLKKERVEIIEVTPKALQQLHFDIRISFEQEQSPENERLIFMDFISTLQKMFGQTGLLSAKKMLYRTIEKFGESISDYVEEQVITDYERERFGFTSEKTPPTMVPSSKSPEDQGPKGKLAETPLSDFNQSIRGQMFGGEGAGQAMQNQGMVPENILKKF